MLFSRKGGSFEWNKTLIDVLRAGKTEFYLLTTEVLDEGSNSLPFEAHVIRSWRCSYECYAKDLIWLREYWSDLANDSFYEVYLEKCSAFTPLIVTRGGEHDIGGTSFGEHCWNAHRCCRALLSIKTVSCCLTGNGDPEYDVDGHLLLESAKELLGARNTSSRCRRSTNGYFSDARPTLIPGLGTRRGIQEQGGTSVRQRDCRS